MSEEDEGGLLNYLKKLLTPSPPTGLASFDIYETEWRIITENNMGHGQYKKSVFNDERGYRIAIRTKGEYQPEEYVVKLMPYDIAYYDDPNDVIIPDKYEFGNDNVMYFEYFGDTISGVGGNSDIAYIADDDDVKLLEYNFGDSDITQTLETEREAEDLTVAIMETMESSDWESHRLGLENLPPEYRQPPYPT